jgi:hypothetical protein
MWISCGTKLISAEKITYLEAFQYSANDFRVRAFWGSDITTVDSDPYPTLEAAQDAARKLVGRVPN